MWSGIVSNAPSGMPLSLLNAPLFTKTRRYLALWWPFLPTDRLRRAGQLPPEALSGESGRPDTPLVLVERDRGALRITAGDRQALALNLGPGLALADARARVPGLVALPAQPEEDRAFLVRLAAWCERFTPLVALDAPDGLLLDVTGGAHLFGGEAALLTLARRRLAAAGLPPRAAIAGTPDAARALARFGPDGSVVPMGGEMAGGDMAGGEMAGGDMAAMRPLPVAALGAAAEVTTALRRAGLRTLGDLADRRAEAIAARFGAALVTRLHAVLGREDRHITPLRRPPDCLAERQFAEPLVDAGSLEVVVEALIREAAGMLERRGEGGRRFELAFFRVDGHVRHVALETGRPSRDLPALLRLWREQVAALADPLDPGFDPGLGFDAIRLEVTLCEPMPRGQGQLDGRGTEDESVAELIDRLSVRFGRDRVLRFVRRDTHDPRREVRAVPAASDATGPPWPRPEPGEPPTRPLQLFEPPQPIETVSEIPDAAPRRFRWRGQVHEVARAEGPERIGREWWRDADTPVRDYYRVEDTAGHRFWVFRAGLHGEDAAPRWFLHGLFA